MPDERPWLESLAACIPHGVALIRADGVIAWANHPFSRLVGIETAAKGRSIEEWIPDWALLTTKAGSGRIPLSLHRDGAEVEVLAHLARCKPGIDAAWSLHLEDQSVLRALEVRLAARERSYSFLREHTSDSILRVDTDFTILWSNASPAEPFHPGCDLRTLLPREEIAALQALLDGDGPAQQDVTLHSAPGVEPPFVLTGVARRLQDDAGRSVGVSLLLRDDWEKHAFDRFVKRHSLSPREEEIVLYVVQGYSNLNIATILGLSESGVKFHLRNVFQRAKVSTRTELMAEIMA